MSPLNFQTSQVREIMSLISRDFCSINGTILTVLLEAQKFKKLFRDLYPRKSGDEAPQLELSSTISSSSASFTTDSGNTSSIYPWEKTDESETRDSGG